MIFSPFLIYLYPSFDIDEKDYTIYNWWDELRYRLVKKIDFSIADIKTLFDFPYFEYVHNLIYVYYSSYSTISWWGGGGGVSVEVYPFFWKPHLLFPSTFSIEEESNVSSCTKSLELKNMELHGALKHMMGALSRVDTYVTLLALQSLFYPLANSQYIFTQNYQEKFQWSNMLKYDNML